jgi:uncharacterized membrane protein (DUF373 family)
VDFPAVIYCYDETAHVGHELMTEDFSNRITTSRQLADQIFQHIETLAYVVLGALLAVAAFLGIADAAVELFRAAQSFGNTEVLVAAVDGLLFVLMVVEILHTVRASFRSGTLVCEPFLIVGLIASIRRVLVITLQSSQVNKPGNWSADSEAILHSTMLELAVLGALIFVMVASIYLLRKSDRPGRQKREAS